MRTTGQKGTINPGEKLGKEALKTTHSAGSAPSGRRLVAGADDDDATGADEDPPIATNSSHSAGSASSGRRSIAGDAWEQHDREVQGAIEGGEQEKGYEAWTEILKSAVENTMTKVPTNIRQRYIFEDTWKK